MDLVLVPTGFAVGVLVGLTGVGGGALMTPALMLYGIPPSVAVGTDLVYAAVTKSVGALVHQQRGNVDWRLVARLAAGSLPAAAAMLWLLGKLGTSSGDRGDVVTAILGVALVLTAIVVLARPWLHGHREEPGKAPAPWLIVTGGVVLGTLVTASSVGAGALGAALLLMACRQLPVTTVVGTDIAHAVLLALAAGIGRWRLGTVDTVLLATLAAGSVPGVYIGARLSDRVPGLLLTRALAVLLLALGIGFSARLVA